MYSKYFSSSQVMSSIPQRIMIEKVKCSKFLCIYFQNCKSSFLVWLSDSIKFGGFLWHQLCQNQHFHNLQELSLPVLTTNLLSPPGRLAATDSQTIRPIAQPAIAPTFIAQPVKRLQNMQSAMGTTAEPIITPMKRYTQPRLICGQGKWVLKSLPLETDLTGARV